MDPLTFGFCYLLLIVSLLITGIILFIHIIVKMVRKKSTRSLVISLVISSLLLLTVVLFGASHPTYYKYNDWVILNSNIGNVQKIYGDFDVGTVTDHKAGKVAYYIYTDNGPIMPDHLRHYYYIEYDENGMITTVYDRCEEGG